VIRRVSKNVTIEKEWRLRGRSFTRPYLLYRDYIPI
jgi:hypothetical protein